MQVYLVGGAVRDGLLGLPVKERDWVVVGGTREELAAPRLSRSRPRLPGVSASGHARGVRARAARAQDRAGLSRIHRRVRARSDARGGSRAPRPDHQRHGADPPTARCIDPFGGARDIEARVLRHVSAAFVEDPVRVLRVARFAARFAPLGFRVRPETLALMRDMVARREVDALVPERVWQETEKALREPARQHVLQGAARMRRACAHLSGNRRAVRRAAAGRAGIRRSTPACTR